MSKVKITESELSNIIKKSVNKVLVENAFEDYDTEDNEFDDEEYPDELYEWGKQVQELGYKLNLMCGEYRNNPELYEILKTLEGNYNKVCGDLNTYDISGHWQL